MNVYVQYLMERTEFWMLKVCKNVSDMFPFYIKELENQHSVFKNEVLSINFILKTSFSNLLV